MPAITFKGTPIEAITLINAVSAMTGPLEFRSHRKAVIARALKTWPELDDGGTIQNDSPVLKEERSFQISAEEQTVLAEGFLGLCEGKSDRELDAIVSLAKSCKVGTWLENQFSKKPVPSFTQSDEAVHSDVEV